MRARPLFLILFTTSIAAQTWAPIGAKWTYKQGHFGGPDTNLAVVEVVGETIIDGRTCSDMAATAGWLLCHKFIRFTCVSNDSLLTE